MIKILFIGKTNEQFISAGIDKFLRRINHFYPTKIFVLPGIKKEKLSEKEQKIKEEGQISNAVAAGDIVVLLDEKGKEYTSRAFSVFIEKQMQAGSKNIIFIIGGPYGVSENVKKRASHVLSLSSMTFSHQLVRLLFLEQLYRAFTIIKGLPYHHE